MRPRRLLVALIVAIALLALLPLSPGCLTPPAMMPALRVDAGLAVELYPPGTERVELLVEDGTTLRGLFVPAEAGAPVVLHLLESSGSAASLKYHYYALCEQLADLGYSSLLVDYTGVGASDGSPSPRHLARDATAMWGEALRRAGDDPARVVLRGISIGTLAAAHLLEQGTRPGATILVAPVRAESAVARLAARRFNALVGWLAGGLYRDVSDVDLVEVLSVVQGPLLVVAGEEDFFLEDAERRLLRAAVREAGGDWRTRTDGHIALTIAAHQVLSEEIDLLQGLLPGWPDADLRGARLLERLEPGVAARFSEGPARERLLDLARWVRLGDASTAAALALAGPDGPEALRWRWALTLRPYTGLPFEALVDAVSLDGPAGPLPLEWIERCGLPRETLQLYGTSFASAPPPQAIVLMVRAAMHGERQTERVTIDLGWERAEVLIDVGTLVEELRAGGASDPEVRATAALVLLRAHRFPARLRAQAGEPGLEVWDAGAWQALDLDPPDIEHGRLFGALLPQALGRRAMELVDE